MGTLLRFSGGLIFFVTLFLPTVGGCGEWSQFEVAAQWSYVGAGLFLAALAFGLLALLAPLSKKKKPSAASESFFMFLAMAFAGALAYYAHMAIGKGGNLLRPLFWQEGGLGLIFLGSYLRWRKARRIEK